jgi:hypothetical protein
MLKRTHQWPADDIRDYGLEVRAEPVVVPVGSKHCHFQVDDCPQDEAAHCHNVFARLKERIGGDEVNVGSLMQIVLCVTYIVFRGHLDNCVHEQQEHVEHGEGNWHGELVGDCLQRLCWHSEASAVWSGERDLCWIDWKN